mgnify:CR=1 FL=1
MVLCTREPESKAIHLAQDRLGKQQDTVHVGIGQPIFRGGHHGLQGQNIPAYLDFPESVRVRLGPFTLLTTFDYSMEQGWGLTTMGDKLIMSDGSHNLYHLDPNLFRS